MYPKNVNKNSIRSDLLFLDSAPEHQIIIIIVIIPNYYFLCMGDRHKNLEDPMISRGYIKDTVCSALCKLNNIVATCCHQGLGILVLVC